MKIKGIVVMETAKKAILDLKLKVQKDIEVIEEEIVAKKITKASGAEKKNKIREVGRLWKKLLVSDPCQVPDDLRSPCHSIISIVPCTGHVNVSCQICGVMSDLRGVAGRSVFCKKLSRLAGSGRNCWRPKRRPRPPSPLSVQLGELRSYS